MRSLRNPGFESRTTRHVGNQRRSGNLRSRTEHYGSALGTFGAAPYRRVNATSASTASALPIYARRRDEQITVHPQIGRHPAHPGRSAGVHLRRPHHRPERHLPRGQVPARLRRHPGRHGRGNHACRRPGRAHRPPRRPGGDPRLARHLGHRRPGRRGRRPPARPHRPDPLGHHPGRRIARRSGRRHDRCRPPRTARPARPWPGRYRLSPGRTRAVKWRGPGGGHGPRRW